MKDFLLITFLVLFLFWILFCSLFNRVDTHDPFIEGTKWLGALFGLVILIDQIVAKLRHK